jgi:hypothetical protein
MNHDRNLRSTLRRATGLGCRVAKIRKTGELRVSHPAMEATVRINGRKKAAPRHLTVYLKRLEEESQ